jgi:hypothetical protein
VAKSGSVRNYQTSTPTAMPGAQRWSGLSLLSTGGMSASACRGGSGSPGGRPATATNKVLLAAWSNSPRQAFRLRSIPFRGNPGDSDKNVVRLVFNCDPQSIPPGSVRTDFIIERRTGSPYAQNRFAKFVVIKKPATKARKGINPFTKEPTIFKAKPARKVIRARPVKAVKDAVA